MSLRRVTITGADDSTYIDQIVELSREFPFVEWGILVSKKSEGEPRFPSRDWINRFWPVARTEGMMVSTHVCGTWVRQLLNGNLHWPELPAVIQIAERMQINTHSLPHTTYEAFTKNLASAGQWDAPGRKAKEFIFQMDGVNDGLAAIAFNAGINTSALFDKSGGAGILPGSWPKPFNDYWCGYAGGLGPDNVTEQIEKIKEVCEKSFWIDMERRVRTQDDSKLDMVKVRDVLEQAVPFIVEGL